MISRRDHEALLDLWAGVLQQAIDDLTHRTDKTHNHRVLSVAEYRRGQADYWFHSRNTGVGSFIWVCKTLGLEPAQMRGKIYKKLNDRLRNGVIDPESIDRAVATC